MNDETILITTAIIRREIGIGCEILYRYLIARPLWLYLQGNCRHKLFWIKLMGLHTLFIYRLPWLLECFEGNCEIPVNLCIYRRLIYYRKCKLKLSYWYNKITIAEISVNNSQTKLKAKNFTRIISTWNYIVFKLFFKTKSSHFLLLRLSYFVHYK